MDNKIKDIKNYLSNKNIKFWSINSSFTRRNELYTIFGDIESKREVKLFNILINVLVDHEEGENKYTGESSFSIDPDLDNEKIFEMIDISIKAAYLVKNKRYEIIQERYRYRKDNLKLDLKIKERPVEIMEEIVERVDREKSKFKNVTISSLECFIEYGYRYFINSFNNEFEIEKSNILLDVAFLAGKNEEVENQLLAESCLLSNLNVEQLVSNHCNYAIDTSTATTPVSGKYKVVVIGDILENFFSFFIFHALGSSLYNQYSVFKVGERVAPEGEGDSLNIYSDPTLRGGFNSVPSDGFGYPTEKFKIIENSILKQVIANVKYSQYLNMPFTGELTNTVIAGGKYGYEELCNDEGTLIITQVSAFEPKEVTGDFSAEIRMGYLYEKGRLRPIKGGSISGNLRELVPNALFSKEMELKASYFGPKGVKLFGVDVAGD